MRLIWIRLFGFDMVYENQPSETISQICDRARVNDRCALRHRSCALIARDFCSRDLCKTQTRARAVIVWYDDHHRRYAIMMMMIIRWRCWCGTIGLNIRWHCRSFVADKQHIKSVHRFRARTHHRYLWITPRDWHGCASQEKKTREWRIRYIYSYINIVLVGHHPGEERRVVNAFNHMWYIYMMVMIWAIWKCACDGIVYRAFQDDKLYRQGGLCVVAKSSRVRHFSWLFFILLFFSNGVWAVAQNVLRSVMVRSIE